MEPYDHLYLDQALEQIRQAVDFDHKPMTLDAISTQANLVPA